MAVGLRYGTCVMEIVGQYLFNFEQTVVWAVLMTPEAIARAIPGAREMHPVGDIPDTYRIVSKLNSGGLKGMLEGVIQVEGIEAPHRYQLLLDGEALQRKLKGTAHLELEPVALTPEADPDSPAAGRAGTRVRWTLTIHASDEITTGEFTRGLIQMSAAVLSKKFFKAIALQLEAETISTPAETSPDSE